MVKWTRELGTAVIKLAQEGGFETLPLPESDIDIFIRAEEWHEEAKKEYVRGVKHPAILAILNTVNTQLEHGNTAVADKKGEEPDHAQTAVADTYPRRSSGGLSESDEREAESYLGNLPVPNEVQKDATPMPADLSEIGDKQVRRLSSEYNSYLGRAKWVLSKETNDLANATHLRDSAYRKAYKYHHTAISLKGERPTKDIIDAFAQEDENYKQWDARVKLHQERVVSLKALVEIYGGNVERLSREATLRQYEWERSR